MAYARLSDEQWAEIEWLIPKQVRGRPRTRNREMLDAILYVLTTGCRWEELPEYFPPKSTVHLRFQQWAKTSFFPSLIRRLRKFLPESEVFHLDSTLKAAKKGRQSGTGQTRQGH